MNEIFAAIRTTGPHRYKDEIIDMALLLYDGEVHITKEFRAAPSVDGVDEETMQKRIGYDDNIYSTDRLTQDALAEEFVKFLDDRMTSGGKMQLISYDARGFVSKFLQSLVKRHNEERDLYEWFWYPPLDLLAVASFFLRNRIQIMQNMRIHSVAKELKVTHNLQYKRNVLDDARLMKGIFDELVMRDASNVE